MADRTFSGGSSFLSKDAPEATRNLFGGKSGNSNSGYENMRGKPLDPEDHPAHNKPTATEHHEGTVLDTESIPDDWKSIRGRSDNKLDVDSDSIPNDWREINK